MKGWHTVVGAILVLGSGPVAWAEADANYWPFTVRHTAGPFFPWPEVRVAGPLFAVEDRPQGRMVTLRPLWIRYDDVARERSRSHLLYPLLNFHSGKDFRRGHLLNLVRWSEHAGTGLSMEVFPFFFSRPDPGARTLALWPIAGTLHNRFGRDRIDFVAWPAYVLTQRDGERRDHYLYPFVSVLSGPDSQGWGVWPLWGRFQKSGDYRHQWAMWPVYYHYFDDLDKPVPYERFGIWPFYTRETAEGLASETWVWPFFGVTRESDPRPEYVEHRYLWPFVVRGSGEERHVERWLPFYANERSPGREEVWWAWPLWKEERFEEAGRLRERQTLLYFLYRDERQALSTGEARLNTLWPLWAYWEDGAGRSQLQLLDPLTVFFPSNPVVKDAWSPLFSLLTYERHGAARRVSLFWDLCVWERGPAARRVQVGPIFQWESGQGWSLLKGLVGRDGSTGGWTLFWNSSKEVAD